MAQKPTKQIDFFRDSVTGQRISSAEHLKRLRNAEHQRKLEQQKTGIEKSPPRDAVRRDNPSEAGRDSVFLTRARLPDDQFGNAKTREELLQDVERMKQAKLQTDRTIADTTEVVVDPYRNTAKELAQNPRFATTRHRVRSLEDMARAKDEKIAQQKEAEAEKLRIDSDPWVKLLRESSQSLLTLSEKAVASGADPSLLDDAKNLQSLLVEARMPTDRLREIESAVRARLISAWEDKHAEAGSAFLMSKAELAGVQMEIDAISESASEPPTPE